MNLEVALTQIEEDEFFEQIEDSDMSCYEQPLKVIVDFVKSKLNKDDGEQTTLPGI